MKVVVDAAALRQAILKNKLTITKLCADGRIAKKTLAKVLRGEAIQIAAYARLTAGLGVNLDNSCRLVD